MRRFSLIICALLICLVSLAGDIKHISITYEYISDNTDESPEQAEQTALHLAKQRALEEHFGLDVVGITSTMQRNRQDGEQVTSSSDAISIRETLVRGEWIETTSQKVLEKYHQKGFWYVKVYVAGRARNHSTEKPEIKYAFINNVHDRQNRDQYYDGDDLLLRFSSPINGALCVYLVDANQIANCLLPNPASKFGCQQIEANCDYLFFYNELYKNSDVILDAQSSSEHNVLYVIFSPNTFTKAIDQQSGKNSRGDYLPRQLSYEDFMKWLAKIQTRDENMVVRREVITIRR